MKSPILKDGAWNKMTVNVLFALIIVWRGSCLFVILVRLFFFFVPFHGLIFFDLFVSDRINICEIFFEFLVFRLGLGLVIVVEFEALGDVFQDSGQLAKEMGDATFEEISVLCLTDFFLEFFNSQVLREIDKIVEHFDA